MDVQRSGSSGRCPADAAWWDRVYATPALEWLDDPAIPDQQKRRTLHGLDRFNRLTGAYTLFARWTVAALPPTLRAPRILELGAGHGALSRALVRALERRGLGGRVTASDISIPFVRSMQEDTRLRNRGVRVLALDATALALKDDSFDVVVFTQALHHLEPPQVVQLVREGTRVARSLVLIDGWRHPLMLGISPGFWMLGNWPSFRDGVVSLTRMYSVRVLETLVRVANPALRFHARFALPAYMHGVVQR